MGRGSARGLAAVATLALLAAALPSHADHAQPVPAGGNIHFSAKAGGNEWWVEVGFWQEVPIGCTGCDVTRMEVMDDGGPWFTMTHRPEWGGTYSANYHIEPGHRVMFRATFSSGHQVTSCWFTHPGAVEQCEPGSPPVVGWQVRAMGNVGAASFGTGDMAIGDADNDGRRDVVTGTAEGLFHFEWTGTSWAVQRVDGAGYVDTLALGDANGDGRNEIFSLDGSRVVRHQFRDGFWTSNVMMEVAEPVAADITFGDIDGAPGKEVYIGVWDGTYASVYQARFAADGQVATFERILLLQGYMTSLWVGDGDRDGSFELYIGHGSGSTAKVSRLRHTSNGWQWTELSSVGSTYGESYVVAGDGDRDGRPEVYSITDDGQFRRLSFSGAGWTSQTPLVLPASPSGLFLADGDAEAGAELYVPTWDGQLFQIRWDGSQWVAREIARPRDAHGDAGHSALVVVGDGDGDGKGEAYVTVSFWGAGWPDPGHTQVFQVAQHPAPTAFDARFSGVRGNEWWIQANVAADGATVAKVDVRLNGGAWQPLPKQSWGGWAASYRAVQGTQVQFRATSSAGATDLSDCYQWIPPSNQDAAKVTCGAPPPPPAFDATFSGVKGNAWWVQANVAANQPLAGVDARVNCGAWQPLTLQSWGGWAKSFHVPDGSKIDFRARSTAGAQDVSGGYVWPSATPTGGC